MLQEMLKPHLQLMLVDGCVRLAGKSSPLHELDRWEGDCCDVILLHMLLNGWKPWKRAGVFKNNSCQSQSGGDKKHPLSIKRKRPYLFLK